jgi:hypothetical protein
VRVAHACAEDRARVLRGVHEVLAGMWSRILGYLVQAAGNMFDVSDVVTDTKGTHHVLV